MEAASITQTYPWVGAGKQTAEASWSLSWHKSGETHSLQQGFAVLHQFGIDLVHEASGRKDLW